MVGSDPRQVLATYLPAIGRCGGDGVEPPEAAPFVVAEMCTVLFADLSGFTALTEQLSAAGREGAEQVAMTLNAHLGPLVAVVEAHGGDIVKFAGDALLVSWRIDDDTLDLRTALLAAAQCGLAMQAEVGRRRHTTDSTHALGLRVGVATGPLRVVHLGEADARRVILVSGDAVDRATRVGAAAQVGEVRIGRLAHQLVGEELSAETRCSCRHSWGSTCCSDCPRPQQPPSNSGESVPFEPSAQRCRLWHSSRRTLSRPPP